MGQVMSIEEMEEQFDGEWVLIDEPEADEMIRVQRGVVLWHGKDRAELDQKVQEMEGSSSIAILLMGRLPEDAVFLL